MIGLLPFLIILDSIESFSVESASETNFGFGFNFINFHVEIFIILSLVISGYNGMNDEFIFGGVKK